jgi:RimJ/RimL family protein N-acetyltransferase
MKNDILFFVKKNNTSCMENSYTKFDFYTWYPKHVFKPKGISYINFIVWFIFYIMNVFRSNSFSINLLYLDNKLVHYTYIFPSFYRFPFMDVLDIQLGDIWTSGDFQKMGIATSSLLYISNLHSDKNIWFLCKKSNNASINLALKCGFELVGRGYKNTRFINIFSQYILNQ